MQTYSYIRKYRGLQVTLSDTNAHNLGTLITAVDPKAAPMMRELNIQSDPGNNGSSHLYIGDVNISPTRYGCSLLSGQTKTYIFRLDSEDVQDLYLKTDTSGSLVNIEMVDF